MSTGQLHRVIRGEGCVGERSGPHRIEPRCRHEVARRGNKEILGQSAVAPETGSVRAFGGPHAGVVAPAGALPAGPAAPPGVDDDGISDREPGGLGTERRDPAGGLVAEREGKRVWVRAPWAAHDVEVRAAESRRGDLDEDLRAPRIGHGHLGQYGIRFPFGQAKCPHRRRAHGPRSNSRTEFSLDRYTTGS